MSKKNNAIDNLKSRVLGGNPSRVDFSKPLTTTENKEEAVNMTKLDIATANNEEAISDTAAFNAKESADRIIAGVEAEKAEETTVVEATTEVPAEESTIEVSSLEDVTSGAANAVETDESQKAKDAQFEEFMARLKKAEAAAAAIVPTPVAAPAVKHSLIQLPADLSKETPEELTRLMKNVQSKKCRSKAMGRKVEYEDSLVAEERIKAAREALGGDSAGRASSELPEDLSGMAIEEIVRNLKNVQSKKCMAKAMGRTEVYDNMVVLEEKLKAQRDVTSPKAAGYHLQSKGLIVAKIEELRVAQEELLASEDGDEESVVYNQTWIEALEWVMSAVIPGQEQSAK